MGYRFVPRLDPAVAIRADDVGICFRAPAERIRSLKEYAIRKVQGRAGFRESWALSGVTFDVRSGETFGIVGPNGSGKSTLLRAICRVVRPDTGRVVVRGSVAPVIELGSGFERELTGRENIRLYGSILGYRRTNDPAWFDDVLRFSGLEEHVEAPLRTYSSGMIARLAFSVATAVEPSILALDEVLSVGDAEFRERCERRLREFRAKGTTIVVVSHDLGSIVRECDRVLWLERGRVRAIGASAEVVAAYVQDATGATA